MQPQQGQRGAAGEQAGLATPWATQACYPVGITTGDVVGGEEHGILDEVGQGTQDEGHKEMHVDVVAGAVELPGGRGCRAVGARAGEVQGSAAHPSPHLHAPWKPRPWT